MRVHKCNGAGDIVARNQHLSDCLGESPSAHMIHRATAYLSRCGRFYFEQDDEVVLLLAVCSECDPCRS